ncbi:MULTISPECIES: PQQ-binding-like beta-propeller repeat protein [unclassified Streptomyces]|uniref:outer membrane protein assembly factor BamB family protein n=1 Tax=unclassified Streptomyces TaxID=2593676 RepID=UPI003809C1AE
MAPQRNTGAGAEAEHPEYAGHYHLESCLGSGGMGVVHLARSTSGMKVAVKVVHGQFARDPEFRGRFRQEIAAARQVSGAFTAPVVDADPEAERPWMATLFIPGPTLSEHVKRNGPMGAGELRRLMAGLSEALRDIHRVGVVHRDLKPSNVLLAEDGPKVIDFGISRPKDSELRTETGKLIGTPPFMAPEQFRRPREVGPAADIFALGSVLVHAATGRGPFDSDSPYVVAYQVVHDEPDLTGVPETLAPLVLRCLAKEPDERPTPDELMRELRSVAALYDTQAFIPEQRAQGASGEAERAERAGAETAGAERGGARAERGAWAARGGAGGVGGAGDAGVLSRAEAPSGGESGAGAKSGSGSEVPDQGDASDKAADAAAARRPRSRVRRRLALVGGAAALALAGTVALVVWPGDAPAAKDPRPRSGTAAAPFAGWEAKPVRGAVTAVPQCSYGAGKLLCAQPGTGRSGTVFALDPERGALLWKRTAPGTYRTGAPLLAGGLVQRLTGQDRRLDALDPGTGRTAWRRDLPGHAGMQTAGGTLLLTAADGKVTGVDGTSGKTRWSRTVPGQRAPYFSSFARDPLAYATSVDGGSTRVTAVDPATGDVRWDARLDGALKLVGSQDGRVYLLSADPAGEFTDAVVRYDPGTRRTRRVELPVPRPDPAAGVHGDTVYLMSTGGALEAVDMTAGKRTWQVETSVSRGSAPAADARHVYVSAPDGRLLAVAARDGRLLGQTRARFGAESDQVAGFLPAPLVVGGRVYAGAPDGTVFAVDGREPAGW